MTGIALLLPDFRGGGVERIRIELAREFVRLGHPVEFVLMRADGDFLSEARAEFPVVDLQAPRARQVVPALAGYLRQARPTALLAAMWPLTVIAPAAACLAGFRGAVVVSEHGIISAQYRDWGRLHRLALRSSTFVGYRLASGRVGVSQGVAADMASLSLMTPSRMTTIHNPVRVLPSPTADALDQADALWGVPSGRRILTVGNLKEVKNHPLLLRSFEQMGDAGARLMILGQGANEGGLRALAADLGIAAQVIFPGFHADPAPFYASADLFVLSSDYEGFGNVIVEALSFGLPVVSTDCPSGPAEILDGDRFGRLVPVGDAPALAQAMVAALAEPADQDLLKRRAADFSPEIAARSYLSALGLT